VTCSGGAIERGLIACNSSRVTISGGGIMRPLWTYDNSRVTISGGRIGDLWVCQNSRVTISGGKVGNLRTSRSQSASRFFGKGREVFRYWRANRSPQVTISGGSIGRTIYVGRGDSEDSVVKFVGSDFAVDGTAIGYGKIDTGGEESIYGTLTGTLAGGEVLNSKFYLYGDSSIVLAPEAVLTVDIRPGICPNRFPVRSRGVLPVTILGTESFSVRDINPDSVRLEGVRPYSSRYHDTATFAAEADDYNCTKEGPDGYPDLTLKFKAQEIAEALGDVNDGDEWMLILTAELSDGTPVAGTDWVVIYSSSRPFN
jgi:hypothetical protein